MLRGLSMSLLVLAALAFCLPNASTLPITQAPTLQARHKGGAARGLRLRGGRDLPRPMTEEERAMWSEVGRMREGAAKKGVDVPFLNNPEMYYTWNDFANPPPAPWGDSKAGGMWKRMKWSWFTWRHGLVVSVLRAIGVISWNMEKLAAHLEKKQVGPCPPPDPMLPKFLGTEEFETAEFNFNFFIALGWCYVLVYQLAFVQQGEPSIKTLIGAFVMSLITLSTGMELPDEQARAAARDREFEAAKQAAMAQAPVPQKQGA